MTHQARQVCHGVMVALPLPGTSAVQVTDLRRLRCVRRVSRLRLGMNPHLPVRPHADGVEHVDHLSHNSSLVLPARHRSTARHDQ
jgi:hypothetical protein